MNRKMGGRLKPIRYKSRWWRFVVWSSFAAMFVLLWVLRFGNMSGALATNMGILYLERALDNEVPWALQVRDKKLLRQARNWLRWAVVSSPELRIAWGALGFAAMAAGEEDTAISAWRRDDTIVRGLLMRGKQARAQEDFEQALGWLRRAAEVDPANRDPWYFQAQVYEDVGEWQVAVSLLEESLKRSFGREVGRSDIFFQMGYIRQYRFTPKDVGGAWADYTQALALDDFMNDWDKAKALHNRGVILEWEGRLKEALEEYDRALEVRPSHYGALLGMARVHKKLGNLAQAERLFRSATQVQPRTKWAYRALGELYMEIKQYESALEMYRIVLQIDPEDRDVRRFMKELESQDFSTEQ